MCALLSGEWRVMELQSTAATLPPYRPDVSA